MFNCERVLEAITLDECRRPVPKFSGILKQRKGERVRARKERKRERQRKERKKTERERERER